MARNILIVDDNAINRQILRKILSADYAVFEAENGQEALTLLLMRRRTFSAVLLDIVMPVMDGYETLSAMQKDEKLARIPVIVTTGNTEKDAEKKALSLGATDFVTKPFDATIIKHRLDNLIKLSETSALVNALQLDRLTGLWNREAFFTRAAEAIAQRPAGYFVLASVDIDNFKVINDQYGTDRGDEVLKTLAKYLKKNFSGEDCLCGRISADNFILLFPLSIMPKAPKDQQKQAAVVLESIGLPITLSTGQYLVEDKTLSLNAMYDRANIAQASVKGRYDVPIAMFSEEMRNHLLLEQAIVNDMHTALSEKQFQAWLQPQYNHSTGALIGAEALARWLHPARGMISPGEFIPVFERNGFIYELDKYIWERVCKLIQKWTGEGRSVLPVSVNISRFDLLRHDLVDTLCGLVSKYGVPVDCLRLEITESAFAGENGRLVSVVKELIERGFTIEIDDFGSGYSSLNTLKEVPAQVVKLDMRFLEGSGNAARGGSILESMVRMTKWLGMSVIAEGVEEAEQADYLKSIGCNYIQGFYYARPMPVENYEKLLDNAGREERRMVMETVENLNGSDLWSPASVDSIIFNSFVGAACIYEYHNGNIELLRATKKYERLIGSIGLDVNDIRSHNLGAHLDAENKRRVAEAVERSIETRDEVTDDFTFRNLPNCAPEMLLRTTLRVIATAGERKLVYCTIEDLTEKRAAEKREREALEHTLTLTEDLRLMMDDMAGGFLRLEALEGGRVRLDYANDFACRMLDAPREQLMTMHSLAEITRVHPDDRQRMQKELAHALEMGGKGQTSYRVMTAGGGYMPVNVFARLVRDADGKTFINAYFTDMSEKERMAYSLREALPALLSAIMESSPDLAFAKDRNFNYIYCSPAFAKFTRQKSISDVIGKNDYDFWTKEEADRFRADDEKLFFSGEPLTGYVEPIPSDDSIQHYCTTSKYILRDSLGEIIGLYGVGRDITLDRSAYNQLRFLADNLPGGIATYTLSPEGMRVVYMNDGYTKITGYSREEHAAHAALGKFPAIVREDQPVVEAQIKEMLKSGAPVSCVFRIRDRASGVKWVSLRARVSERRDDVYYVNAILTDVTERQNMIERLQKSEEEFRVAADMSGAILGRYDIATGTYHHNDKTLFSLGFPADIPNAPQAYAEAGCIAEGSVVPLFELYERIRRAEQPLFAEAELRLGDGEFHWCRVSASVIFASDGTPSQAIIVTTDISDQREKEAVYKRWQQQLSERAPDSYTLYCCNLNKNTAYDTVEGSLLKLRVDPMKARSFNEITREYAEQFVSPGDRSAYISLLDSDKMLASYYRGVRSKSFEYREMTGEHSERWLRVTIELVEYPHSPEIEAYLMYEDIDEAKRAELLVRDLAENDPLTGVLNRATFIAKVDGIIDSRRGSECGALLMLDVDGFKKLNDTFGHAAGDQALIDMAAAMRAILREDDLTGRLGGDEFLIFLKGIPSEEDIANKARQILTVIRKEYSPTVTVTASIGVAVYPRDGEDFHALYHRADKALYAVKETGKNHFAFYSASMDTPVEAGAAESAAKPAEASVQPSPEIPAAVTKRRMLIVEDNRLDAEVLAAMFKDTFVIDKAYDGNTALIRLRHYGSAVSVVLLDLIMPGMDGFEVLDKMRESTEMQTVPVIVVSGSDDRETSLEAIRRGATDFVSKPVDPDIIRIRVQSAVSKAENERLRAQNSFLLLQNDEVVKYRTVLKSTGTVTIEYYWQAGTFTYDPNISSYIAGTFDGRRLWQILLSDFVASARDVQSMQSLVHNLAGDRTRTSGSRVVRLKTPSGAMHRFRMNVIKLANEFRLTDKMILTFNDIDADAEGGEPDSARFGTLPFRSGK